MRKELKDALYVLGLILALVGVLALGKFVVREIREHDPKTCGWCREALRPKSYEEAKRNFNPGWWNR